MALTQEALCPQSDADFNYLCSPFNLRRLGPCAGLGSTARVRLRAPTVLVSLNPIKQDMLSLTSSPVTSLVPFSLNSHSMDINSYTRPISPPPTTRFVLQSELFPLCSFSPPRPPSPSLMVSNLSKLEQSNKILLFLAPSCTSCCAEVGKDKGTEALNPYCYQPPMSRAEHGRRHKESGDGQPAMRQGCMFLLVLTEQIYQLRKSI